VAVLLLAATAVAKVDPPVSVRLMGKPRPATPGERYEGALEITTFGDAELTNFRLESRDWSAQTVQTPASLKLSAEQTVQVTFSAVPSDPVEPLEFVFEWNGIPVKTYLDFSPETLRIMIEGSPAVAADPSVVPKRAPQALNQLRPEPYFGYGVTPPRAPAGKATYNLRVHGWWGFDDENWNQQAADGASVYVQDVRTGAMLGAGVTNSDGTYDFEVPVDTGSLGIDYPDIVVYFAATNSWVNVRYPTNPYTYSWYAGPYRTFTGTDLDLGALMTQDGNRATMFILTNLTRAHRFLLFYPNPIYDIPGVTVIWPSSWGWGASYSQTDHIIKIQEPYDPFSIPFPILPRWNEGTHCHEFGHHWQYYYSGLPGTFEYCNGYCDDAPPDDCGHCMWCPENAVVAWMEAFPNWFSQAITSTFSVDYGATVHHPKQVESLAMCHEDSVYHDPMITEGFFSALMRDIEDSSQDSHGLYGWYGDALAMGVDDIFRDVDYYNVMLPSQFLDVFRANHPIYLNEFWETAANCGINFDEEPPGVVTGLTSTSHVAGVPSTDTTVDLTWLRAPDDASGIAGYAIELWSSPQMPTHAWDIGDVTSYTTEPLPTGSTLYFNICAVDRDGNWSDNYASFGPIEIAYAGLADLEFQARTGWAEYVVPRPTPDANALYVPLPSVLHGNANSTYWNLAGWNSGTGATPAPFEARVVLDGADTSENDWWTVVNAHSGFTVLNAGPMSISGGRHTFEVQLDATEAIPESNEAYNTWAQQWIWQPISLVPGNIIYRLAPPQMMGGWNAVRDGSTRYFNCDGLRFASSGWWNAVVARSLLDDVDYDCLLFDASTGPRDGFDTYVSYSLAGAGTLDAIVVNRNTLGDQNWDLGILNSEPPETASLAVVQRTSTLLAIGDSITFTMGSAEMLRLYEFYVPSPGGIPISITVETAPDEPVWINHLDETFTYGSLAVNDGYTSTVGDGFGRVDLDAAATGYHCVVVYRHQRDGYEPRDVTLEISPTPPNLRDMWPVDWYRSLVPRPAPDGVPSLVELPDTLQGGVSSTYLNLAFWNRSAAAAPSNDVGLYLDGQLLTTLHWGPLPGEAQVRYNYNSQAWTVRGGRHMLAFRTDDAETIEEISEDDNCYGRQYCWSPLPLTHGIPLTLPIPAPRDGDWDVVDTLDAPAWFNCDGLRMNTGGGWWVAAVVAPGEDSNVNLRLHDPLEGVLDGFGASHVFSCYWDREIDYVMVNYNVAPAQTYDVSVTRSDGTGNEDYTIEAVHSIYREYTGNDTYGPFTIGAGHSLDLHEFYLPAGTLEVELENVSGAVDWALVVHRPDEAYMTRSSHVTDGSSFFAGPGEDEAVSVELPYLGFYSVAVFKRTGAYLGESGSYRLHLSDGVTAAEPDETPPVRTALTSIYPNPFNPQTRIAFDLAERSTVRLEIYDLQGTRVRALIEADLAAGRHEATWDGRDGTGRLLATGVYFARLEAGATKEMRKLTLVK
jgi:hypothetical protein